MADEKTFEALLTEFRRVGVDPDTFSAILAVRSEDALRALRALPDDAGAAAFLKELRNAGVSLPAADGNRDNRPTSLANRDRQRKNKSA